MKRFVTAVFKHETNTFSPIPTPLESFGRYAGERGPVYGEDALEVYRGTGTPVGAFIDLAAEAGAELVFPVAANANPSGPAPDSVLDHCTEAICEAVRSGCDAAFLDLHGGMATQGHDDPEGELLRRLRAVAPELPIAVALDFHTNLSAATIDNATVVTGHGKFVLIVGVESRASSTRRVAFIAALSHVRRRISP